MRPVFFWFLSLLTLPGLSRAPAGEGSLPAPLGTRIADFTLPQAHDGQRWSLVQNARDAKAVVVVFLGTQCPVCNSYVPTLTALHQKYQAKGVVVVGINSNQQDDAAAIARHAREYAIPFPVLKDQDAAVAERFRAARVPEAFVLDGTRTVRYRGRIDDQFGKGVRRPKPTANDLIDALEAVLGGKAVERPATEVVGCPISRPVRAVQAAPKQGRVTYTREVARILQNHCQECHRPGEIGPFALLTYRDAAAWAAAIREAVAERRMPPWHADPAHGKFANDRSLPDADRSALLAWVDHGCPEGDPADLPPPKRFVEGWGMERPDEVITMNKAMPVPAEAPKGGIPYQYILAGKPFTEDRWVQATEVRPGDRSLVHHITVFVAKPGTKWVANGDEITDRASRTLFHDFDPNNARGVTTLASFVPGDQVAVYPPGVGLHVPKGSQLVFEVHYTPNGKATLDRSAVGLIYAKERPRHEVKEAMVLNWTFAIPPGAANHPVAATTTLKKDIVLLSLGPHMHLRGKSFEFQATLPNGTNEILLKVPRYDFNWQTGYVLAEPKKLPKGTKIACLAHFDNSAGNPNNPDPAAKVFWGDQTWEEMMIGYFDFYEAAP